MDHAASRWKGWRGIAAVAFWLLASPAWAQTAAAPALPELVPDHRQSTVGTEILQRLVKGHYNRPITLNDQLSSDILDAYLKALDPARSYFRAADIREFEPLRTRFDELLAEGELDPAFMIFNRYRQRMAQRLDFVTRLVAEEFAILDFEKEESLARKNAAWAGSEAELRGRWRRQVKGDVLNRLLAGTAPEEIREALQQRYENQRTRLAQSNAADVFRIYTNAFLRAVDPHTTYLPPHQSENFNIHLSLSLEGIGAVLQADGANVKVLRLVPGGPAEKAGDLKPEDRIVGVAQGETGEMVEVLGMRLDQVVSLIRGPKETTVRLEIIPQASATGQRRVIRILRDKVELEDQQASKQVLEVERGERKEKIGVIRLPTFYVDFEALRDGDLNYRSTARDVKRLIGELKEEGVRGLVVDLRNNGGGGLHEAIAMVGLFIDKGPVVQVRDSRGVIRVQSDREPGIVYGGPLAVLVNRFSVSASEIFAGAIQDYGRGLVLGGQTFGKGTVQTLIPILLEAEDSASRWWGMAAAQIGASSKPQGQLKLTQAKFYRISGGSTQHRGVIPDIEFPGVVDKTEVGESSLDNALAWDSIDRAGYTRAGETAPYLETLAARHRRRLKADPDLVHLMARIAHLEEERQETTISLREKTRRERKERDERRELESENTRRAAKGEKPFATFAELEAYNETDTAAAASPEDDPILDEAANVLADFVELTSSAPAFSAPVPTEARRVP